ncbi:aldehyde dehydrogenase family protein [Mycoplasmopsis gallinarum]|uniref:Aldehyde dehydrogenase n=1 Tax=Mycoplasmopsis gallinarum TaxID=29557 RepID=A0A168R6V7_9BACT|nr:aldehyde dehydrogenase family protein [Mycoplasmopsis gallinarum]OAB48658.1 Aldehyde dehydrogenase [Mycoplasmopsis gallinarum]
MNNLNNDQSIYNLQKTKLIKPIEYKERIQILKKLKTILLNNENKIYSTLNLDLNKSKEESYITEFGLIIKEINLFIKKLKKWTKPIKIKRNNLTFYAKQYQKLEPLGQSLIISPWNYPFMLTFIPLIGSIAAGNRTIIKTSDLSLNSTKLITEIINENFLPELIYVMDYQLNSIQSMLDNHFDLIFYTGNSYVAKNIQKQAAFNLSPTILELGGKCPLIIDRAMNLELLMPKLIRAKSINSGQTCIAPDYIYIHESQLTSFLEIFEKTKNELKFNYLDKPKIISPKHYQRLMNSISNDITLKSNYAEQKIDLITFLSSWDAKIMQEEIFGPFLPVLTYQNLNEVIEALKTKEKPLTLYFYSENKANIKLIEENTTSGSFVVNDLLNQLANPNFAFGGVGFSGMGRYRGYESLKSFSNIKTVFKGKKWFWNWENKLMEKKNFKFLQKLFK